jgi:plastocyanin
MRLHAPRRWAVATAALASLASRAGDVEVRVLDANGQALRDAVVFLESAAAQAAVRPPVGVEIAQSDKRFDPSVTVVPVGTAVSFPNRDTVRHHVYSFSPTKRFEIKLYVGTPAAPVVFDKPGIAVLGCNIHDQMAAWVVIVPTPWYAKTDAQGVARWPDIPGGGYRLRTWHAALPVGEAAADQPLRVEAKPLRVQVTLAGARP